MNDAVEIVVRQPGHPERVIRLPEGTTLLGRADDADVVLSDVGVSRRHARLIVTGSAVRVEDLGSGNGTYLRGERIDRAPLVDGDELVIDPFVLQVRIRPATGADVTPQLNPRARLDVVQGPGLAHTTYPIPPRGLTIGRSDARDIVIPDPASSRHHCSIFLQQGKHVLRDMGSANGVYVNGQRVDECVLRDGDVLTVGNTELRYVAGDGTRQTAGGTPLPPGITFSGRPARAPARAGDAGTVMSVLATAVFVLSLAVAGFLVVLFLGTEPPPAPTTRPSGPPAWTLTLDAEPDVTDPATLTRSGVALVKANDPRGALERFWLLLRLQPDYASAERFAYAAGEQLLLDALRTELDAAATAREAQQAERDALLARARRRDRSAIRELERRFRHDPEVMHAMGWPPTDLTAELQRRLAEASDLATRSRWAEAARVYAEVAMAARDPAVATTARAGLLLARKELARQVHDAWATGVRAEASGDLATARAAYERVLETDPDNPSARLRLATIGP